MIIPKNIIPVTSARRNLMKLLKEIEGNGDPLVITKDGKAAGILMSPEEYESLVETSEILGDKKLLKSLQRAQEDFHKGRTATHDQVFKE